MTPKTFIYSTSSLRSALHTSSHLNPHLHPQGGSLKACDGTGPRSPRCHLHGGPSSSCTYALWSAAGWRLRPLRSPPCRGHAHWTESSKTFLFSCPPLMHRHASISEPHPLLLIESPADWRKCVKSEVKHTLNSGVQSIQDTGQLNTNAGPLLEGQKGKLTSSLFGW